MFKFLPGAGRLALLCSLLCGSTLLYAQPANDACADAEAIPVGVTITGTTVDATMETDIAYAGMECQGGTPDNVNDIGVFYSFVAPATRVSVVTESDNFNTELTVLSGTCGALTCVAYSNDGVGIGTNSEVILTDLIE
ncbi:MAG: hypothetical protein AAFN92_13400, partial [Bacteroidota bacterium]